MSDLTIQDIAAILNGPFDGTPEIPNLRAARDPHRPWRIEGESISATVRSTRLAAGGHEGSLFLLVVDMKMPPGSRLVRASSLTQGSTVNPVLEENGNRLEVDMRVPAFCPVSQEREPVVLMVEYVTKTGEREVDFLNVDDRCLIGDTVLERGASTWARLAEKYLHDPTVEDLLRRARPYQAGSVQEEVARLKRWVGWNENSFQEAPNDDVAGWEARAYNLSPTETARFGGVCRDWTIFAAAYLVQRGAEVYVDYTTGHVWAEARMSPSDPWEVVDLVGAQPYADPPLSRAAVGGGAL